VNWTKGEEDEKTLDGSHLRGRVGC
jgi:hypothetical protein